MMAKNKEREPRAEIQRDYTKEANAQRTKLYAEAKARGEVMPGEKQVVGSGLRVGGQTSTSFDRIDMKGEEFEARFEAAFDYCLIKMTPREETTPDTYTKHNLVEIPQVSQQHRNKDGIVISIGPHGFDADYARSGKPNFKVGDRVWYGAWAGQECPCPPGYLLVRSPCLKLKVPLDLHLEWH
jgi:co-chaperonin GroES (HSP10)